MKFVGEAIIILETNFLEFKRDSMFRADILKKQDFIEMTRVVRKTLRWGEKTC